MNRIVRTVVPAVLALTTAASVASAQTAPPVDQAKQDRRPSPETMQRMEDGRIAMIKGALKLNDAQLKLWQPVEDQLRARQAQRAKDMQDWAAKRDANAPRPSPADRMERQSAEMAKHAEQLKTFAAAFRPFYDSLTPEQKAVAGPLMAELGGRGHHMHGHRFAAGEHRGPLQQ